MGTNIVEKLGLSDYVDRTGGRDIAVDLANDSWMKLVRVETE